MSIWHCYALFALVIQTQRTGKYFCCTIVRYVVVVVAAVLITVVRYKFKLVLLYKKMIKTKCYAELYVCTQCALYIYTK
jgi:hypothetical protein